jgi:excisionase family DNA binding protein
MRTSTEIAMFESASKLQREGLSISEACAVAGIGRTKIYQAIADGDLKARKCGKRTLVLRDDLRDFLAALPGAA